MFKRIYVTPFNKRITDFKSYLPLPGSVLFFCTILFNGLMIWRLICKKSQMYPLPIVPILLEWYRDAFQLDDFVIQLYDRNRNYTKQVTKPSNLQGFV